MLEPDVLELLREVCRRIDDLPAVEDALHRAARIIRTSNELPSMVSKIKRELPLT